MGLTSSSNSGIPKYYSYQNSKDLITQINKICKQNQGGIGMLLHFQLTQLKYNDTDWKKSMIPGCVAVHLQDKLQKFNVIITLQQAYKAYQTLKHFQKKNHPTTILTPSEIEPDEDLSCCICCDKAPSMMLPCSHQFCDKCTQIYIIEQVQKKCPICRMEFKCGKEDMQRKIYTVIGEDQQLSEGLRNILLDILKDLNGRQVQNICKKIKPSYRKMNEE